MLACSEWQMKRADKRVRACVRACMHVCSIWQMVRHFRNWYHTANLLFNKRHSLIFWSTYRVHTFRPAKKLSGGVLAWLSVWSEVRTCIWPRWCHCHSLSLASVKSRLVLPHPGSPGKKAGKRVHVHTGEPDIPAWTQKWLLNGRRSKLHDDTNLWLTLTQQ